MPACTGRHRRRPDRQLVEVDPDGVGGPHVASGARARAPSVLSSHAVRHLRYLLHTLTINSTGEAIYPASPVASSSNATEQSAGGVGVVLLPNLPTGLEPGNVGACEMGLPIDE